MLYIDDRGFTSPEIHVGRFYVFITTPSLDVNLDAQANCGRSLCSVDLQHLLQNDLVFAVACMRFERVFE
jgi:hypothetical protein